MRRSMRSVHKQAGFTLLESLVALVVLSVGMLGIGALYVESLQASRAAVIRSKAVTLAADMADRIRANRQGRAAYAGADANNGCVDSDVAALTLCTPAQMAANDVFLWRQMLANASMGIPNAQGTITFDGSTDPDTYVITVQWAVAGEDTPGTYRITVQI